MKDPCLENRTCPYFDELFCSYSPNPPGAHEHGHLKAFSGAFSADGTQKRLQSMLVKPFIKPKRARNTNSMAYNLKNT